MRVVAAELALRDAVKVAVWRELTEAPETVKVAEVAPERTGIEVGAVATAVLVLAKPMERADAAAALSVTVQDVLPGAVIEVAAQDRPEMVTGGGCQPRTVTAPPVPETAAEVPSAKTPTVLAIEMGTEELLVDEARVTVTTATVPLPIVLEFMPATRQVVDPLVALQLSVLPGAVRADPAVRLMAATSLRA